MRNNNVTLPTGVLYGKDRTLTIQATGQLVDATAFRRMVVANVNGAPVHLGDVGNVYDGVQNNKNASWYNGDRAIVLAVIRQPGTNTVAVADRVKAVLEEIRPTLPPSVQGRPPLRPLRGDQGVGARREALARSSRWCSWSS